MHHSRLLTVMNAGPSKPLVLPADRLAALERLLRLREHDPEVAELDANPVIVRSDGVSVVDVRLRVAAIGSEPDAAMRSLREPS